MKIWRYVDNGCSSEGAVAVVVAETRERAIELLRQARSHGDPLGREPFSRPTYNDWHNDFLQEVGDVDVVCWDEGILLGHEWSAPDRESVP